MNRSDDAERSYQEAIEKTQYLPEGARGRHLALAHTARGYLKAFLGKAKEAEQFYQTALSYDEGLLDARHNLASLVLRNRNKFKDYTFARAVALFQQNLDRDANYLPSRLSLARALADEGRTEEAIRQHEEVLRLAPEYPAARMALADLHAAAGRTDEGLRHLRLIADEFAGRTGLVWEKIGDLEARRKDNGTARDAYQTALAQVGSKGAKKRLKKKLARLP